ATDVVAGGGDGDVSITTTTGNIAVGSIDATATVTLNSGSSILDAASDTVTDIKAQTISLSAVNDIGTVAERLEIEMLSGGSVSAQSTTSGVVALAANSTLKFTSVTTVSGGIDIIGGTNTIEVAGTGMSAVGGGISIDTQDIKLSANLQTDGGDVALTGAVIVNGPAITIATEDGTNDNAAGGVTIDGTVGAMTANTDNLIINAVATGQTPGNVMITGIVAGTEVLDSLTIDGGNVDLQAAVTVNDGGIAVDGTTIKLGGDLTTSAGTVELTGAVTLTKLGMTTTIDTGAGADVTITGTVDGSSIGNETLVIDVGTTVANSNVTLTGTLGVTKALGGVTVTATKLELSDDIFTDGRGAGDGAINLSAVTNLDLTDGTMMVPRQVTLDSDADSSTSSDGSAAGIITLPTTALADINEPTVDLVIDASADDGTSQDVTLKDVNVKSLSVSGKTVTFDGTIELEDTDGANALTVNATDVIFTANAKVIAKGAGGVAINGGGTGSLTINTTATPADVMFDLTAADTGVGVSIDNGFTVVELGDDIATNDGAVSILSPIQLTANVLIDTATTGTAGAGVTLTSIAGTTDATENLTIDGGTDGDVSISGTIGTALVSLGSLTITDADDIVLGDTAQVAGLSVVGSTTFTATGKITTSADINIVADKTAATGVTLTGGAELAGNDLIINADGGVVISAAIESASTGSTVTLQGTTVSTAINLGSDTGGLDITEASLQQIKASIETLIVGDASQTGTITINDAGGLEILTPLTLRSTGAASDVDLKSNLTTAGDLTVNGGATGSLNVAAASVSIVTQGGNVVIGESIAYTIDGSALAINSSGGDISLIGSVSANADNAGGENLTLTAGTGDITLGDATTDTFGAAGTGRLGTISIVSADAVVVNASVTAESFQQNTAEDPDTGAAGGNSTTFNESIDLDGGDLRLVNVTNVTFADDADVATTNGGNVFLDGDDTGTLTIGTSGMTIDGSFTEQDFATVNINGPINAGGDITMGDLVIGDHLVLTTAGGNITVGNVTAAADSGFDVVLTASGTVEVGKIGTDADSDDINDVQLTGPSGITLNGDIFTGVDANDDTPDTLPGGGPIDGVPAGNVTMNGPVTLAADITINTADANNNGTVTFTSDVSGDQLLTIAAGTGAIDFDSTVGDTTPLSGLLVSSSDALTFDSTVEVDDEGIDITAVAVTINSTIATSNGGTVTITNAGLLDIAPGADMNLDGAFLQNGAGKVSTAGNITTSSDNISFAEDV
ncbi:hypothetical protein, partial [Novipirellula rosea]|uniref:beta strand repeat-containing protein n=1 Tax=Novipirellula rosea TaxID=1031540 RepID=UPI0031EC85B0